MKVDINLYTDYLLSSFGATTATGLSAMVDGDVSHDQVTRMLSERDYTSKDLWQQVRRNPKKNPPLGWPDENVPFRQERVA